MKKLQTGDYSRLASVQADAMNDLCNITHLTFSSGTYSTQGTETRVMVSGVPCGIDFTGGNVVQRGQVLLVDYDAILRLSASQSILLTDEVQLIEKGEFVISGTFKPSSQPIVNSSVQKVQLKRVV
jgi:hypothetical protein